MMDVKEMNVIWKNKNNAALTEPKRDQIKSIKT